jgi:hypothetical protein
MLEDQHGAVVNREATEAALELVAIGHAGGVIGREGSLARRRNGSQYPEPSPARLRVGGPHDDAICPWEKAIRIGQARELSPDADHRLLHGILGAPGVVEDVLRRRIQPIANPRRQLGEGGFVARLCTLDQLAIQGSVLESATWLDRSSFQQPSSA